ncbi:MAG TPA: carboxypeptidase-like regulatory domain-containing protein, partial [bacterium]|nr:carboxypeptidase-like regulatory domain-containing protein [bacterium]
PAMIDSIVEALQKKNVLKALYMFTKYGSKAIVSAGDIESLKKDLYDSVALLLLELRNVIDTVSISEQSAVSDRTVFINSKLENSLSNVHSVNSFDRFLENIKISADSGALSGYAFNRAILTTGSKDIEKIKKDSQNRPVLIYADTQKTETTVHENISHSLFTDRGLRSDTTLFDVFNDIDISKLNKKLIEAQLTLFYSFKGREYIQKMDYIFSVYPSDELDIITVEPSTIEGSVVDSSSIMPISGATVILRPGNIISTSDVLGKFIFTNLNAGYYEIEINMDGYLPAMTGTMVTAGEYKVVPAVYMALEPVEIFTTSVSGSAVNFYTGAAVTDVRIILKKGNGETLSNEIYSSGVFT